MTLPPSVTLVEVGPRDGLQNEAAEIPTQDKIAFIDALTAAGHTRIEVGAFVNPKAVPRMADTADVFAGIEKRDGVEYSALVPNMAGLERAKAAGVRHVSVFAAASETFSQRNINKSIAASLDEYGTVIAAARREGIGVRGYVSTAFGCPYEGDVAVPRVIEVSRALFEMGVAEVAVSDTIGIAHPGQVQRLLRLLASAVPLRAVALHLHDTRGTALVNVYAALQEGIVVFDAAAGGLGGCPFAPGAAGNLATEDLLFMLDGLGIRTGIDRSAIAQASAALEPFLGHPLPSRLLQAEAASRE